MKIIMNSLMVVCIVFASTIRLAAQTIMHIGDGGNVYVEYGANISLDSLVLTPLTNVLLSATNITKNETVSHTATGNYISRVYNFSTPVANYNGKISIVYQDKELNGIAEYLLILEAYNNGGWQAFTDDVSRSSVANFVTTAGLVNISLDELTLASLSAVLPVQWVSVEATRDNNLTYVKWITADEVNGKYYQVQKSNDRVAWQNVSSAVAATNGAALNNYSIADASVLNGSAYYRIVETDVNGKMSYSPIVSVSNKAENTVTVYPIPAHGIINVKANDNSTIKRVNIYDASGKIVMMKEESNNTIYNLNISYLANGYYMMVIETNTGKVAKGFVKK